MPVRPTDELPRAVAAFRSGELGLAATLCRKLVAGDPGRTQAWVLLAKLAQAQADYPGMLAAAGRAAQTVRGDIKLQLLLAEAEVLSGRLGDARARVAALSHSPRSASEWSGIGQFFTSAGDHAAALAAYRQAAHLEPGSTIARANLANALATNGDAAAAGQLLDQVLESDPDDADAHYQRATLRRVRLDDNHIETLQAACARQKTDSPPLCYALAREYEDCGDFARAWEFTRRGATARRAQLSYRVERDEQVMADIGRHLGRDWYRDAQPGTSDDSPIFVFGLPRSGTTLVERILASHSSVAGLGEINDLAFSLIRSVGPHRDREELIRHAASIPPAAMGLSYLSTTRQYGRTEPRLVDKTPLNFLYLGLIRAAFPGARIVHVRRHPVAACHALYKTLFRMACPFSYDLEDIARYYLAYTGLMRHWRDVLGDAWLSVDYETLVQQPERVSRDLLAYCGLPWEAQCLEFHRNPDPVATASAAQVREPIHTGSVDLWHRYSEGLSPLIERLRQAGVDVA